MKVIKTTGKIDYKDRLKNSINGNPRYEVGVIIIGGRYLCGNTASDSMSCYGNWGDRDNCVIWYHHTRAGNIVFDRIERIQDAIKNGQVI